MVKNPKTPKKDVDVIAKAVFRPDTLMWLAIVMMLFTFFRWLYYA